MSIYRRRYKDRHGKSHRSRRLTAEFEYQGRLYRHSGFVDRDSAQHWLLTESNRVRRGATGYVKPMLKALVMQLIAEFAAYLRSKKLDQMYVYTAERRLIRLAGECGWVTLGHMSADSLDAWKHGETQQHQRKKKGGERTKNQYIQIAQEFGKWLVKPSHKLPNNPLSDASLLRAKHNDQYRRSGTLDEINKLLATCSVERRLYYLVRIYNSKMRGRTVKGLTWGMMHMDAAPPFAKTPPELNKSRKEEKHPFRYDIAQQLRKLKKDVKGKADDRVFPDAPTLNDFRDDLAAAGIPFELAKDKGRLDYHALRRTLVKIGKSVGLSLDQVSLLLGHKDVRTTRKYYDEDSVAPELGAFMETLPELGKVRMA